MNSVEVRAQLEKILASQELGGSDQLKRLLRLVVDRTLDGKPELLKEYNLGLEVFQRPPDYDPKVDPIVRVQARRLRSKLEEYYAKAGGSDPVVIEIPKGAYVPAFHVRDPAAVPDPPPPRRVGRRVWLAAGGFGALSALVAVLRFRSPSVPNPLGVSRSVAILPLQLYTGDPSRRYVADQVTEVLTTELARSRDLRVLSRTTASRYRDSRASLPEIASALGVRWVVEGGVGLEGTHAYLKLRAVDSTSDRKIWADVLDCELKDLVSVTTAAANRMAAAILGQIREPIKRGTGRSRSQETPS